ncbi:type II toxin-antitoxin system RelE/ParE family toxin [Sphingomonas sp. CARO-RG-8B-R24-01]|uniref:type II toxin-antitoxin system RelE/ParE family toxin n=1 Tax=Sphingomonas sp. CARO-RG-8B-R24-01 TaxID=2914831 RepID=UPI001F599F45
MRFIFSRPALQDVAESGNWIARDDPVRADRFVEEIRACCQNLCAYPFAYPIHEDFPRQGVRHRVFVAT